MDLVFTVEEQPTMDIQAGLTFSGTSDPDELPISAMGRWNDRNFLGNGNQLGVGINLSTTTQSLTADYTQNWVFGSPLSVSFGLTFQHSVLNAAMDNLAPYFNGDETYAYPDGFESYEEYYNAGMLPPTAYRMKYDQWQIAPSISSGYRFSTPLGNLGVGGGLTPGFKRSIYNADILRPFDPVLRNYNNQWVPAFTVGVYTSLDQRDIYYDPSKGYYVMQRFTYHGILSHEAEQYIRSDSDAEVFFTLFNLPVTDNWSFKGVLGIHSGVSFILPNFRGEGRMAIENANRLAIDGMFTARGWSNLYSTKGNALWENWMELRFPLVRGFLAWDFFFDAAALQLTPYDLFHSMDFTDMRFSVGGAFRITIPQLPFRIGVAKRFYWNDSGVQFINDPLGGLAFVLSFTLSTY
jgi:outer membrane protein insertion porin family